MAARRDEETVRKVRRLWALRRVSTREIAALLGCSPRSVARMVRAGRPGATGQGDAGLGYAQFPWPDDAAAAVRDNLRLGRRNGPGPHIRFDDASVVRIRELVAEGKSQAQVARELGTAQSYISDLCSRRRRGDVPMSERESDLLAQRGVRQSTEATAAIQTTGRIIGPNGVVYRDVRQAELASGLDRIDIAKHLMRGTGGWRYELGTAPEPPTAHYGTAVSRRA